MSQKRDIRNIGAMIRSSRKTISPLFFILTILISVVTGFVYQQQTQNITQTIKTTPYFYVDNNTSDIDNSTDKGTQSNFTAQQYGPDSIYDTLTEASTVGQPAFKWINPVDVTPATADQWVDVDASSHIPVGATGVILHYYKDPASSPDEDIGFRKKGSTNDRHQYNEYEAHSWAIIGVDENRVFQAYIGDTSTQIVLLVGYATNQVVFFTNSVDKTAGSSLTWLDIDISSDTGADTAIGVILEVSQSGTGDTWGVRKDGSTDDRRAAYARLHKWAIVGVSENEIFETWVSTTTTTFHVLGYVKGGAVFFTNGIDKTPVTTGSWVDVDVSGDTGTNISNGVFIEVHYSSSGPEFGFRKNGSTEEIIRQSKRHAWGFVEVDENEIYEAYISATGPTHHLIGYSSDTNYELDLEVQWTNVDYDEANEELAIYVYNGNNTHSLDTTIGYMIIGDGTPDWGSVTGTISFWIKWDTVGNRPWGQHDNMETRFSGTNLVLDWGAVGSLTSGTSFTADKWYFIAIVWNENTDNLYLYVGDQNNPPTLDAQNNAWTSTVSTVGVTQNNFMASKGGINPTDGHGDDLRYWDTDRSLAEIQNDYDTELTGSETNLRSYFKLNNNFDDIGPDNNDGSGSGTYSFSSDVPFSAPSTENIRVDVWDGTIWQNLFTDLTSGWNNVTVTPYLNSSTFTIRFNGGIEINDITQDSWNIDVSLLHVWT